jgi:hypothetical protein
MPQTFLPRFTGKYIFIYQTALLVNKDICFYKSICLIILKLEKRVNNKKIFAHAKIIEFPELIFFNCANYALSQNTQPNSLANAEVTSLGCYFKFNSIGN